MTQDKDKGRWLAIYIAILVALGAGIYGLSQRVNYDWRWSLVPTYLVNTSGVEIRAPFAGFTTVDEQKHQITLKEFQGTRVAHFDKFDDAYAASGDLVFDGDLLAHKHGWRPGILLVGLWVTIELSLVSLVFALALGLIAGLGRVSPNPVLGKLAANYVELIRGTPLLVQIFIFYFFIGTVLNLSAFWAGVSALAVFTGAYVAEIIRAGIEAVPRGQMEAARSLGMARGQAMRYVILPQALKRSLPPLAGQFINLIKDSSLVSVMALTDLTKAGREVVSSTFAPFEVWFTVAAMYLILTGSLSFAVRRLEKRVHHD